MIISAITKKLTPKTTKLGNWGAASLKAFDKELSHEAGRFDKRSRQLQSEIFKKFDILLFFQFLDGHPVAKPFCLVPQLETGNREWSYV